ncbi:Protein max [Clonorchis sinensis]|uniref:Protein max n=1 Tax=Clonorchis sinensis TaxID=79923 RepID=A0A8T1M9F4_CLOSI|nr:Protein max [Clonorchis sinensis]
MARYLNTCSSKSMHAEQYDVPFVDDDEDDDDLDDDDIDGYDALSDFDDEDDLSQSRNSVRHNLGATLDDLGENDDFRRQRSISEGSANQLEPGDDNRRDHHNQLERKRRASIKTSYNDLREVIPSLRGSKASRAVILQRAVECIEELVKLNRDHTHCVETLKRQNDALESKVQDLQRYIQRLDGEEAVSASCCSSFPSCGSAPGNGALRLLSGSITPAGTSGSGSSGVPVYRLLPHDAADKPGPSHGSLQTVGFANRPTTHNGTPQGSTAVSHTFSSRTRTSPAIHLSTSACALSSGYSGMNALSAAVSLVASTNSAFSSASSSTGSNCDPPQSSSQRSSPGCLSSSSSTASSFNQCCTRGRGQSEERSLIIDVPSSGDIDFVETNGTGSICSLKTNGTATLPTSPTSRTSSPPSILLTVPVRPLATCTQTHGSRKLSSSDVDTAVKLSDISKRRRLT